MKILLLLWLVVLAGCGDSATAPEIEQPTLERASQVQNGEWMGIYHRVGGVNAQMRLSLHRERAWLALDGVQVPLWDLKQQLNTVSFTALVENEPVRFIGYGTTRAYRGNACRSGDIELAVWDVTRRAHEEVTVVRGGS